METQVFSEFHCGQTIGGVWPNVFVNPRHMDFQEMRRLLHGEEFITIPNGSVLCLHDARSPLTRLIRNRLSFARRVTGFPFNWIKRGSRTTFSPAMQQSRAQRYRLAANVSVPK